MFDYLRNITKSAEEKRQERLNAFLDDALSERDRRQFEQELAQDPALRADLDQLRWVKRSVQQLPRVRAPRNFILDPAVYGQRQRARQSSWQPYPALRLATALTAFFFVLALALDLATPFGPLNVPGAATSQNVAEDAVSQEETLRQADELAQDTELDTFEEEAVEEPAAEEEEAEMAPFVADEETAVAEVAEEAAADLAADEELETLEAMQEESEAAEPAAPGAGAPSDATANAAEATATAEIAALSPQATPQPRTTLPPADEGVATIIVTETAQITEAPSAADEDGQQATEPFPYLLAIEIALGVALVALVVVMLILRRGV